MPTPKERAEYLYSRLRSVEPDVTSWDLICFCSQMLGALVHVEPSLKDYAHPLVRVVNILDENEANGFPSCLPAPNNTKSESKNLELSNSDSNSQSDLEK